MNHFLRNIMYDLDVTYKVKYNRFMGSYMTNIIIIFPVTSIVCTWLSLPLFLYHIHPVMLVVCVGRTLYTLLVHPATCYAPVNKDKR